MESRLLFILPGVGSLFLWLSAITFLPALPSISSLSAYDDRRLFLVFLLFASALTYIWNTHVPSRRQSLSLLAPQLLVLAFLLFGLISVAKAPVISYALLEWSLFLLVFTAVLSLQKIDLDEFRLGLLYAVSFSAFLYVFMVMVNVFVAHVRGASMPLDPFLLNNFINLRYLNQWLSWLIPLLPATLYLAVPRCRPFFWRLAVLSSLAFLWALLIHSGGRGTLFGLVGSAVLLPLLFGKFARSWLGWQVLGAGGGIVLSVMIFGASWPWDPGVGHQVGVWSFNDAGRFPLWIASLSLIGGHPWFGIGPMQFAALQFGLTAHPHSFPIQIAVEWGLPAAFVLLGLVAWLATRWVVAARRWLFFEGMRPSERILVIGVTGSLLTAGAHSLVSGVIVTAMSQVMLVVVVAFALRWFHVREWRKEPAGMTLSSRESRLMSLGTRGVILVVALWFGGFVITESLNHRYNWDVGGQAAWGGYQPRFWHQGKLIHHLDEPWLAFSRDGRPLPPGSELAPSWSLPQGTRE